jgi:ferrous iron transport protein A
MNLKQLSVGDSGRVVGFGEGSKTYRRKLLSLGLTPGTELTVTRCAPMGDPVEIRVRGFSLSLRKDEAASLLVEKS